MKRLLTLFVITIIFLSFTNNNVFATSDNSKSNKKKLNTKKIFREEQRIVQGWETIYGKISKKKKKIKKRFH